MAISLTYYSDVTDGRLQKNVSTKIANELKEFEGKRVEIKIQKLKSTRSQQQNRYYWAIAKILGDELGYTKDEMHEILKFKFLKKSKVIEATGEILEYIGSTATLSKSEFADMTTDLIRWAAESFNVVLPAPGEQLDLI